MKNLIRKQLEISQICFLADPTSQILRQHTQLMGHIYNSDFHKTFSSRLNTVSIIQFATIFSEVFGEQLEIVLTNQIASSKGKFKNKMDSSKHSQST